jgi:hypothetical protein
MKRFNTAQMVMSTYKVDYCKFLGISFDVGPIGNRVRLHKKNREELQKF